MACLLSLSWVKIVLADAARIAESAGIASINTRQAESASPQGLTQCSGH
jgi:ABC-type amino acid transport system permease subunit